MNENVSEVFNGDCMEFMGRFPDNFFDLAIVDPPYGINAANMAMGSNKNRNDGWKREDGTAQRLRKGRLNQGAGKLKNRNIQRMAIGWDYEKPKPEYFIELMRVSRSQIIWGGNYFNLGPTRCIVCWDKCQPWENFSQWEMAWTSFDKPSSLFRFSNTGGQNKEKKIHPTQKPIQLYEWLLKKYADTGDVILDTHMGSQSSRIAAYKLGFDFYGAELDEEYFKAGCERFDREAQQPMLLRV